MTLLKHFHQSNRHIKLAIILAPLLAIGGYILTGILLEEKIDAQPGTAKAMTLQPDCHLLSDKCELLHREIAANIAIEEKRGKQDMAEKKEFKDLTKLPREHWPTIEELPGELANVARIID